MSKITKREILERLGILRSKIEILEHQIRDSLNATTDENSAENQWEFPDVSHETQSQVNDLPFAEMALVENSPKDCTYSSLWLQCLPCGDTDFHGLQISRREQKNTKYVFLQAAYKRCQPCVLALLRKMVDVNCKSDTQQYTALDWAIHGCKEEEINASTDKMVIYLANLSDKKGKR